jgi:ABC-2 type transport system ATP-binding protein
MTPVLSVIDAAKCFGATRALDGASFVLRPGEWLGLLGPNGAGKTTLVRAVSGRVRLDRGRIDLFGKPLHGSEGDQRRRLGIVPQEIALYPALTARENLEAFAALCRLSGPQITDRVDWALEWTALGDRADEPIKRFSGGMKRRMNIACGVLHRPEIVLLDEPTVGVDPQSRQRIWEMLEKLRAEGASLLLTTHQLDEAERVCERIVIIDHGKVIADGPVAELVARTVGTKRWVVFAVDGQPPHADLPDGLTIAPDGTLRGAVENVAGELPKLLSALHAAGVVVVDVRVETPSLQAVFLHLTGRELRE